MYHVPNDPRPAPKSGFFQAPRRLRGAYFLGLAGLMAWQAAAFDEPDWRGGLVIACAVWGLAGAADFLPARLYRVSGWMRMVSAGCFVGVFAWMLCWW